ncbi:MAG: hypothetical protein QXU32_03795 [Nitrososphaerales archaeon]
MITVTGILGNIRSDKKLWNVYEKLKKENKVEKIVLSRIEAQRPRIRRESDFGTDIAISMKHGSTVKHGDVLLVELDRMIIVEYEPEVAVGFRIRDELSNEEKIQTAIKLGHVIGNLHRSLCIKNNIVYMPIQSESEIESIKKMLLPLIDYIDIYHSKIIFEEEGMEVHER